MTAKTTAPAVRERKGGPKLRMVTAYDAVWARIADRAGADIILVGDSVANVALGYEDTLAVSLDEMISHTAAVSALGRMPWLWATCRG